MPPKQQEEVNLGQRMYKTKNKHVNKTNRTSSDVSFTAAWCNRMGTKQYSCHSTAPGDKQINEYIVFYPPPTDSVQNIVVSSNFRNRFW